MPGITFCAVHFTPVACFEGVLARPLARDEIAQLVTGWLVSRLALTNARSATASPRAPRR